MMHDVTQLVHATDHFVGHPKLDRLVNLVLEHFLEHGDTTDTHSDATATTTATTTNTTRVMIFSQYRESVDDIVHQLSKHSPMVRVMSFVGQSTGKNGKGLSQKEQLQVS